MIDPDRSDEDRLVAVDEAALIKALDMLDELSPGIAREDWYHELSTALDQHLKVRIHRVH